MNLNRSRATAGYTLIELMLSVTIIALLASIVLPRYDLVLRKAYQAKAKSNLGTIRTGISLYYTETEGHYPLEGYDASPLGTGTDHYDTDLLSLTAMLTPRWLDSVPIPYLKDRMSEFNEIAGDWDVMVRTMMTQNPPDDVYLLLGPPDYTQYLSSPYAYDNKAGWVYIPNGNYDTTGKYFYEW